jgi:hypothetical protein
MICDPDPMHVRNNRTTFVPVDLQDSCRMSAVVSNRHMLHVYNIPRKWKSAIALGDVGSTFDSKRVRASSEKRCSDTDEFSLRLRL